MALTQCQNHPTKTSVIGDNMVMMDRNRRALKLGHRCNLIHTHQAASTRNNLRSHV
jgi:hypothetical protein